MPLNRSIHFIFFVILSFGCNLKAFHHEKFILQAIELARNSKQHGDHPFGALLVYERNVILTAENGVLTKNDITAHAEMELVRKATKKFSHKVLSKSILYSSTEPCAMCAGAIVWSGIRHVVYGSPTEVLVECSNGVFQLPCREVFARAKWEIRCDGPILEEEAKSVHIGYWK